MRSINIKLGIIIFAFFVLVLLVGWLPQEKKTSKDDFPILKGPYLGQKPPGLTPELFAPDIISTEHKEHSSLAFSPDGKEIYWSLWPLPRSSKSPQVIKFTKRIKEQWTEPQVAQFSGKYSDGGPFFSPDGNKIFFYSERPLNKNAKPKKDSDLWFVERTETGWSEPKPLGFTVSSNKFEWCPSISKYGNLFFSAGYQIDRTANADMDIYISRLIDGVYSTPKNLGKPINTKQCCESTLFIAPDESFLIFTSDCRTFTAEGKYLTGKRNLMISFRQKDSTWIKPKNMGPIFNEKGARFPGMSPDGKYLFFTRYVGNTGNEDIFWVDAKIIEELKPKELK